MMLWKPRHRVLVVALTLCVLLGGSAAVAQLTMTNVGGGGGGGAGGCAGALDLSKGCMIPGLGP